MNNYMKTILSAVKTYVDKIVAKIPTKLSDLEIDMEVGGGASSWEDLKDKPFGSEFAEVEYLPKTTINFNYDDKEGIYYKYIDGKVSRQMQGGKMYTVIIDDIVYGKIVCLKGEADYYPILGSHDETIFTNYPFHIHSTGTSSLKISVSEELCKSTSTHTIEIIELDETVVGIDAKYLPNYDLSQNDETHPDYIKGRTHWQDDTHNEWIKEYYDFYFDGSMYYTSSYIDLEIKEGTKYRVLLGDEGVLEYTGTVLRGDTHDLIIGNEAVYANYCEDYDDDSSYKNTGEPFAIAITSSSYDKDEGSFYHHISICFEKTGGQVIYLYFEKEVLGEVHTLDEKFIPDTIARKEDIPVLVQSDMNEMNESSLAFIKNKTHWYENSKREDLLMNDNGDYIVEFISESNEWVELPYVEYFDTEGELITVELDGVKYRLPVVTEWFEEDSYYVLYHDKFEINYNNYSNVEEWDKICIKTVDADEHQICMYRGGEHWNPLDERFIPETIARKDDISASELIVHIVKDENGNPTSDYWLEDIEDAYYNSGKKIRVIADEIEFPKDESSSYAFFGLELQAKYIGDGIFYSLQKIDNDIIEFTVGIPPKSYNQLFLGFSKVEFDNGASNKPDWNESDESNASFIQNKPFYEHESTVSEVILDEHVDVIVDLPDMPPEGWFSTELTLNDGDTYTVTFDDVTKDVVCENSQLVFDFGTSSEYDIYIISASGIVGRHSYTRNRTGNLKIEHKTTVVEIKQLNEKYIPDSIARKSDISASGSGENGITPHIGENGNWFIGEEDTCVKAEGDDGKTPEKGVDYFTDADKADFVTQVIEALPTWTGGSY